MKLLIISHVKHRVQNGLIGGYGPYIWEMNLWLKHASSVRVVAPEECGVFDPIDLAYEHNNLDFRAVAAFDITSLRNALKTLFVLPLIMFRLYQGMRWADHIHIRCPGNMGLLGCLLQILFPEKAKSVKYAANWDLDFPKPWSYRLQQRIAMNPWLSRNMQVMVYGEWPESTSNMVNFFTATYHDYDAVPVAVRDVAAPVKLLFAGRLVDGKKSLVAAEVLRMLLAEGYDISLDFYGEGPERTSIEKFIAEHRLEKSIRVHGNLDMEGLKQAYQNGHFLVFPTVTEGWSKVIAEAMFWGCVPVTTAVSCIPYMLGYGARGAVVSPDSGEVASAIKAYLADSVRYAETARLAMAWSRQFTLERFEAEIVKLLEAGARHE